MSIESAKAFMERVKNDEDFRKKVGDIATTEERMDYVKKEGFEFSKQELDDVASELNMVELEAVAGGGEGNCWQPPWENHCSLF